MRFGESAEHLEELAEEDPDNIPAALLERPDLEFHLAAFYDAFWLLNRRREITVSMAGSIPQSLALRDIFDMANEFGFDPLYFLRVIAPADDLYRDTLIKRTASKKHGHR